MPLQNRVTPGGEIVATTARGTIMGNRGILHDENKQIVRTSRNMMWLTCRLKFKGRRRQLMRPRTYTELFFLDEAVALAAGHRPCGECRRTHYRAYLAAANVDNDNPLSGPKDLDRLLNESRRARRTISLIANLPDGVFITLGIEDFRPLWRGVLHRWSPEGYFDPIEVAAIGTETALVVTPPLSVAVLRHGYPVEVHPSVGSLESASRRGDHDVRTATCSQSQFDDGPSNSPRTTAKIDKVPTVGALAPGLREEIERHLRVNPVRHGEVFRAMELGLDVHQMGTSRANAQNFKNSVEAMLQGSLPTTRSAARTNSYGYRYLLGCELSPELRGHTKVMLRRLASINPEVRTDEPLYIRTLPNTKPQRHLANETSEDPCPQCNLVHAGDCD
jgi:hypothetical protein